MKPAIEVSHLSKSYQISHQTKAYKTIKDDFINVLKRPVGIGRNKDEKHETFWALDDVSFSVNPGEIFGVIGLNGSGKSTLLKILSRIVDPTKGKVTLRGRTASLLEVGTGFHPELTGRENIYFNGSMLGMSRREITSKFNEIVEFSEIEKFIDTPVKFYSSGMYVRLAFSVAAHLQSEILILDEVLAVGDASFQKKSMQKILSTMEEGRTVLFVSHSMGAVQQICSRGVLLNKGVVEFIGDTDELVSRYMDFARSEVPQDNVSTFWENDGSIDNEYFRPEKMYLMTHDGKQIKNTTSNDQDKWVVINAEIKQASELLTIGCAVYGPTKTLLYITYPTDVEKSKWPTLKEGPITMKLKIPAHYLNSAKYKISLVGGIHNKFWLFEPGANGPSIELSIDKGLSKSPYWINPREGVLAPISEWKISK